MNIDWSKAPEGATHHAIGDWVYKWFKKIDEDTLDFWLDESWLRGVHSPAQTFAFYDEGTIVARPEIWNGEGLPPVGTVCEYNRQGVWSEGTVVALVGGRFVRHQAIVQMADDWNYEGDPSRFRPIRTAEQIAAEKECAEIKEIAIATGLRAGAGQMEVARALYKAGYRKQVRP